MDRELSAPAPRHDVAVSRRTRRTPALPCARGGTQLDPEALQALIDARMPFGKYQGVALLDLPEPYLVWFSRQGFPPGKLGRQLALTLEIKTNGLEKLLRPLR
ncbi:DUF3820 family protein [Nannocystis pusilla]|uniref:DUF3820 family protein n=1 Tax=Nannocystis pusilla TaxID=889268 RepID=A0A9X3F051_9BACT|nr:DUF3820 family protein [Nannocystis pusilla]MCY1012399.1 DUF3820 family protein [Nannocystis pusilla]